MAKKAYIGVNNVARQVKKGYVGVDGVARKIKKAYIGVGGVARPCWSSDALAYYGTITPLSSLREYMGKGMIGNYALFAGGYESYQVTDYDGTYTDYRNTDKVEAYNSNLTKSNVSSLSYVGQYVANANVGAYTLFNVGSSNYMNSYTATLTKGGPFSSFWVGSGVGGVSVGNDYAIFAGGVNGDNAYNATTIYDASLTRTRGADMSPRAYAGTASIGEYGVFAGGQLGDGSTVASVEAYNSSLTKITAGTVHYNAHCGSATVGKYALFAGGKWERSSQDIHNTYSTVSIFDENLTKQNPSSLSAPRYDMGATTLGSYAIFAGGDYVEKGTTAAIHIVSAVVDVFDGDLTRTIAQDLSVARGGLTGATVGRYALFAGGGTTGNNSVNFDIVDVYVTA